jgi:hypothetical protein
LCLGESFGKRIISLFLVPRAYGSSDSSTLFANSNFAVAGTHPLLDASIFPFFFIPFRNFD